MVVEKQSLLKFESVNVEKENIAMGSGYTCLINSDQIRHYFALVMAEITYQRSTIKPRVLIPIFHVSPGVAEHIIINEDGMAENQLSSYCDIDGAVDHPLLESTVLTSREAGYINSSSRNISHQMVFLPNITNGLESPPGLRNADDIMMISNVVTPTRLQVQDEHTWMELLLTNLCFVLNSYQQTLSSAGAFNLNASLEIMPWDVNIIDLLAQIIQSSHTSMLTFRQNVALEPATTDFLDLFIHLSSSNNEKVMATIISIKYPHVVLHDEVSSTVIMCHPGWRYYHAEHLLWSGANLAEELFYLDNSLEEANSAIVSIRDEQQNSISELANELQRSDVLRTMQKYLNACKLTIMKMQSDHNILPFNLPFLTRVWIKAMTNVRNGMSIDAGIDTGFALVLLHGVMDTLKEHGTPHRGNLVPFVVLQNHSSLLRMVGWIIHPVNRV
jgi:hypothetical protein